MTETLFGRHDRRRALPPPMLLLLPFNVPLVVVVPAVGVESIIGMPSSGDESMLVAEVETPPLLDDEDEGGVDRGPGEVKSCIVGD